MKNLNRLLREKPGTKKIDLSFCQLEEIDTLMSELYRFKNLEDLNLSCNRLEKLPEDLSILKTLKKLDISNNLFQNVSATANHRTRKLSAVSKHWTVWFTWSSPPRLLKKMPSSKNSPN
jgi:Leucine-rich repeat (LRR) protein